MSYDVVFTVESEETFDLISAQLLEKFGLDTLIKFQNLTSSSVQKIGANPFLYQIIEENNQIRKCLVHKNCSIFFQVNGSKILIICFWDNRQDPIFK
ncbi:type II toxin-antitoxin system RelE/ParE family toxin [Pedobacter paludis]|uniref:Type II toxin-antitoxin system RelE/ParE family toxin n=1 Tax=Pedobacter paludis TaxID=2203212 RepID=A0A317F5Y6_9SPHI|nr:hypothetical protein [Pedobacter paludis]PWS32948.1 hypothetical protein DF947_07735 [Pedobacter paludis]